MCHGQHCHGPGPWVNDAEYCSGWRIVLVDQRNHGQSAELSGFNPPHTLEAAAQDLIDLIQQKFAGQHVSVIAGHSLGGKTTLEYLRKASQGGVKAPNQVCKCGHCLMT